MIFLLLFFFFFTTNSYNEKIALRCAILAQSSYCNDFSNVDFVVEKYGSLALQGYDNETQTIFTVFRGSSNIHNWLEDIQIQHVSPYKNQSLCVEAGFYKNYYYIKNELFENLKLLSNKYKTNYLLISSHSLGSAASTLFVYDIIDNNEPYIVQYYYNFGSPRVGNEAFVEDFNKKITNTYRIVHNNDIVASVPPKIFSYAHINEGICYNEENTKYYICDDIPCNISECSTKDHLNYLNITMGSDGCNI